MRVIFFELLNQHRIDNGLDTLIISDTHNEEAHFAHLFTPIYFRKMANYSDN